MPSLFPDLFFLGPMLAPVLIRIALAVWLVLYGNTAWKSGLSQRPFAVTAYVLAGLFVFGFLLQGAALMLTVLVASVTFFGKRAGLPEVSRATLVLLWGSSLSLLLLGAGAFALDLPF